MRPSSFAAVWIIYGLLETDCSTSLLAMNAVKTFLNIECLSGVFEFEFALSRKCDFSGKVYFLVIKWLMILK